MSVTKGSPSSQPQPSLTASRASATRPWLSAKPQAINTALLAQWRGALENQSNDAECGVIFSESQDVPEKGISVIIPSYNGKLHIRRCLASLVGQTLSPSQFEIIVVLNGPDDGTREIVEIVRNEHRAVNLRVLQIATAGASRARNAGIAAASMTYTTFIDDDDYVSDNFLEVLLSFARPNIIAIASIADVYPDQDASLSRVVLDNPINRSVVSRSGQLTEAKAMGAGTTANAAKAVYTKLIKNTTYDVALDSGEDVLFWSTVVVRNNIWFYPCPIGTGAVYYRVKRENSVSRQPRTFDFAVRQRFDVIGRLNGLIEECPSQKAQVIHNMVDGQTTFVNDYLVKNPDDRPRVVDVLDGLPLHYFSYEKMNAGQAKELVVAYAFPPYVDTSAIVMAKRVRDAGRVIDVVCNEMDRIRVTDQSTERISGPFVSRRTAISTPAYFSDWNSMEQFAIAGLQAIEDWETKGAQYEQVYSRAHFAASHFLAASYKLARPETRWVAEFSDPLSRDIHNRERGTSVNAGELTEKLADGVRVAGFSAPDSDNCFVWCEDVAYALADEIIFTNDSQLEYMLSYCQRPDLVERVREKAVVRPQPTLPSPFYSMVECDYQLDDEVVNLAYFGNFYATRGLDDVLVAMASAQKVVRDQLRLHVFTNNPEALDRRAEELGIPGSVRTNPYLGYLAFLNLSTKFDCLIVNDAKTARSHRRNPYLPSKWADYRGSGKPVWGLVEPDSPLSQQPLSYATPVGEIGAAVEALSAISRRGRCARPPKGPVSRPIPRQVLPARAASVAG